MPHRTLVKIAGYILGEFGHTIAETAGSTAEDQLRALHEHFLQAEPDTKALLLNTYAKLSHAYGEIASSVGDVLRASATAMDQEVQQRSVEYLALGGGNLGSVKAQVLEMMPHFTERESIVQKTLSKSQADANATMPAKMALAASATQPLEEEEPSPDSATHSTCSTSSASAPPPNLLGDDATPSGGTASPQTTGELLAGLQLGEAQSARAPSAPANTCAAEDLLGLMERDPLPSAATVDAVGGPGGTSIATTSAMGIDGVAPAPAQFAALCVRNEGVLHEDSVVQVGIKMEFQAHQGRIAIFIGNKSTAPLTSVATHYSSQTALDLQPSPLATTVSPRQQQSQTILVQCGSAFGEPPQITIKFDGPKGLVQLVLPLPLPPTKFNVPLPVDGPEFFRRWKGLEGKEAQLVFKLATAAGQFEATLGAGLNFAVLKQVDSNPANVVAAGWFATRGGTPQADAASLLARLEVNSQAGMCRVSVRSASDVLSASVVKSIAGQLGSMPA